METRFDSYCGLYCGACNMSFPYKGSEVRCLGCKSEIASVCRATCDKRRCAESKGIDFCFQCEEYPCPRLIAMKNDGGHYATILKNLERIREKGVEVWLEEQKARWSYPNCGTRFLWYDKTCKECGAKLYNCEDEARDLADG